MTEDRKFGYKRLLGGVVGYGCKEYTNAATTLPAFQMSDLGLNNLALPNLWSLDLELNSLALPVFWNAELGLNDLASPDCWN